MLTPHYELFDHTADLGVRVRAASLAELIVPATDGFYATIGEVATTGAGAPHTFDLCGEDAALLLRDYLAELLHLFDAEQRRLTDLEVQEFSPRRLVVAGQTRPVDQARSALCREVKAVTYHELAIRPIAGGYEATYIVDI